MSLLFLILCLLSLSADFQYATAAAKSTKQQNLLLRESCSGARYRSLCEKTLAPYALKAKTPTDLAKASTTEALDRANHATACVSSIAKLPHANHTEDEIFGDCRDEMSDSVDELRAALSALLHARPGNFSWAMSDAQTWASAALTDAVTCIDELDGVAGDAARTGMCRRRIRHFSRVVSNTLYLFTRAAKARNG